MVAFPLLIPVTAPEGLTVAIPVAPLVHVPPVESSVKVMVEPVQTAELPEISGGFGFTVNITYVLHPVGKVYFIVSLVVTVTVATAVTKPDELIVAAPVLVLSQVPPPTEEVKLVVYPLQTFNVPEITGTGFTLTSEVVFVIQPVTLSVTESVNSSEGAVQGQAKSKSTVSVPYPGDGGPPGGVQT